MVAKPSPMTTALVAVHPPEDPEGVNEGDGILQALGADRAPAQIALASAADSPLPTKNNSLGSSRQGGLPVPRRQPGGQLSQHVGSIEHRRLGAFRW